MSVFLWRVSTLVAKYISKGKEHAAFSCWKCTRDFAYTNTLSMKDANIHAFACAAKCVHRSAVEKSFPWKRS